MNLILFGQLTPQTTYWTPTLNFIGTYCKDVQISGISMPEIPPIANSNITFSIDEASALYRKHQIDGIINIETGNHTFFSLLESHGFARKDIYIIPDSLRARAEAGEDISNEYILCPYHHQPPVLPLLEVHLADHCNLNCKGCAHFSNLVPEAVFSDISTFESDIKRLFELFSNIGQFFLLGGEPLLNPDFPAFIQIVRKYFPYTDLILLSNGILIPKLTDEQIQVLKQYRVRLQISAYPVLDIDKITAFMDAHDLNAELRIQKSAFTKFLNPAGTSNKTASFEQCPRKDCNFLLNGKIAPCCLPLTAHYFNAYFGEHIPENESLNIYSDNIDGWDIIEYLNTPMETCRYCTDDVLFRWDISKAPFLKDDWCV